LRLFACAVPVILYLVYFLTLWITRGIVWSVHLSVGSIVVSGVAGWLISYVLIPPTIPADRTPVS
jgi:hypothetical protein